MSSKQGLKKAEKRIALLFLKFLEAHPPRKVSRHLRCIVLDYLGAQATNGLPIDFDISAWELYDLFNLLDEAADADLYEHE